MIPARKDELLPDARRDLAYIGEVVSTALDGVETGWDEVVREFEDERHATGGLVARWSRDRSCIEGLEIVLIDGKPCDVSPFAARLAAYVELPATVRETAVRDAD